MTDTLKQAIPPDLSLRSAPFLVWPVARREFYYSICIALLPTLAWGATIFGWRAAAGTIAMTLGALLTHIILKRFTRRGRSLLTAHTVGSALIAACLFHPISPAWQMLVAGVAIALILFAWGGPGRERIVTAPLVACLPILFTLFFADMPQPADVAPLPNDRILARDRLFLGDLRDFSQNAIPLARWDDSRQLGGTDAIPMFRPAAIAHQLLDLISVAVDKTRNPDFDLKELDVTEATATTSPGPVLARFIEGSTNLPSLERVGAGAVPGPIGVVSAFALWLGGFYLAYRNILRPKSTFLFVGAFIVGLVLFALTPECLYHLQPVGFARVWAAIPSQLVTLLAYSFFGSDAMFAAIVLLAWPGVEPVTTRGRRTFIILAAITAAAIHRYCPIPIPAATISILFFHPLVPIFDRISKRRSWLNR